MFEHRVIVGSAVDEIGMLKTEIARLNDLLMRSQEQLLNLKQNITDDGEVPRKTTDKKKKRKCNQAQLGKPDMPLDGTVPTSEIEVKTPITRISIGTKGNENNQVDVATQTALLKEKDAGGLCRCRYSQDTEPSLKWRGKSIVMDYGFSGSYP